MRVVCAPNAFKGSLSAAAAAAAIAAGVRRAAPRGEAVELPVADGGDGTLDVLVGAARGGARVEPVTVAGPLQGTSAKARLAWIAGEGEAIIEIADAAGIRLLGPGRLDALRATSRGAGELIAAALERGARTITVAAGGSACTDGGSGLAAALGLRLLDAAGHDLPDGGGELQRLDRVDAAGLHPRLRRSAITVAVDTGVPLLGASGAARLYAPQKGASPAEVEVLEAGLARWAAVLERDLGVALGARALPGAGAAGGCGYGLAAVCGALLTGGAALVCERAGLDAALRGASLAITGEGRVDASTATGKAPLEVARRARAAGVPCAALAGSFEEPAPPLFDALVAVGAGLAPEESMIRAAELLEAAAATLVSELIARGELSPE